MIPTRQSVGFPTVAKIRKGTPKIKQGEREMMGKDLKNKFRIEFLPGTANIRANWHAIHENDYVKYPTHATADGYELEYLRAMIPTESVWDGWTWSNTTFNAAGMLIARADGTHYLTKKDPLTMEYIVKDGEPFTEFHPGDVVSYERDGKTYHLPMKSSGKLSLFLPELGEFVSFELVTSSYIDSLLIEENLRAIQQLANVLNKGIAGGIPLDIYRVQMDSPYHDNKDNKSRKGKQWFIQIKANSAWANAAIKRMTNFALTGDAMSGLLQPGEIQIPQDLPEAAYVENEDEPETVQPESIEGEVQELIIESTAPGPQRAVRNEIITDSAWQNFSRLIERANKAGLVTRSYNRSEMNASTVAGASVYLQSAIEKASKK
jgi:hypothetical protein